MRAERPLVHEFPAGVPELPCARDRLRRWLEGSVEDTVVRHDMLLVGTELCTDAVRRRATGRISLRAWVEERTVYVEVTGPAGEPDEAAVPTFTASPSDGRWRARILEGVCDDVSTASGAGTQTVRCRKQTGRAARPAR